MPATTIAAVAKKAPTAQEEEGGGGNRRREEGGGCCFATTTFSSGVNPRRRRQRPDGEPAATATTADRRAGGTNENGNEENPPPPEFFPDLENLRYWSHPDRFASGGGGGGDEIGARAVGTTAMLDSHLNRQQGVLWKRRDVFRNRWRPRFFVLQPQQGILTYYLLSSEGGAGPAAAAAAATSAGVVVTADRGGVLSGGGLADGVSNAGSLAGETTDSVATAGAGSRNRAASWDSNVSENSNDYDVVPRGTIYLVGCTVSRDDSLSKPEENLYAFTISPPPPSTGGGADRRNSSSQGRIHLAARTPQSRALWVAKIARVCSDDGAASDFPSSSASPPSVDSTPTTATTERRNAANQSADNGTGRDAVSTITDTGIASRNREDAVWETLGNPSDLYANLPDSLVDRIRKALAANLDLCDRTPDSSEWRILFRSETSSAFQKRWISTPSSKAMIKTVSTLNHPPKQLFNLLVDVKRRCDVERNISELEVLKIANSHTCFTYYRYDAVWPASAREFAVVTHWQVVKKGDEKAIAVISFSCPEADQLREVGDGFVRGKLHVNLSLLRSAGRHRDRCRYTRILSFNLGGGVSSHFSNVVISQQANFPSLASELLQRTEPVPEPRFVGGIANDDALIRDITGRLDAFREGGKFSRRFDDDAIRRSSVATSKHDADGFDTSDSKQGKSHGEDFPQIEKVGLLLLTPLLLYYGAIYVSGPYPSLWFLVSAFFAVREVVLLHEGEAVPWKKNRPLIGPITWHFRVDLKGVLRFINNKKEEREELQTGVSEISFVHILACAVATALKDEDQLNVRRVSIPSLLLDNFVDGRSKPISVSIQEKTNELITLGNVDTCNVQTLADEMADAGVADTGSAPGSILILAAPNYDGGGIEASVIPAHPNVRVVAVIGGVHMESMANRKGSRPVLSLSITVAKAPRVDFVSCRRLIEDVRKLLQFPEMCDRHS